QIDDGDDLHAERFVAEDPHVVKPAADFDRDLKHLGAAKENDTCGPGFEVVALLENDFKEECFKGFGPGPEFLTHRGLMCQARAVAARRSMGFNHELTKTHEISNGKLIVSSQIIFVSFVVSTLQ